MSIERRVEGMEKDVTDYLWLMAESACTIPPGEKVGRWTRDDRVHLIFTVLCSLARMPRKTNIPTLT